MRDRNYEVKKGKGKNATTDYKTKKKFFENAAKATDHIENVIKKAKKGDSNSLAIEGA